MSIKVAEGNFRSVAHETKGMASVYKLPDGKNVLRFSAFETSNGPDVHVYLVAASDAKDDDTSKTPNSSTSAVSRATLAIKTTTYRQASTWRSTGPSRVVQTLWRQLRDRTAGFGEGLGILAAIPNPTAGYALKSKQPCSFAPFASHRTSNDLYELRKTRHKTVTERPHASK